MKNALKQNKKFRWKKWLSIIFIIYVGAGIALYFLQDDFLFQSTPLPADYKFAFKDSFEEQQLQINNSTMIDIIKFAPAAGMQKKGVVIYCHGNYENINHYAYVAPNFTKHGYAVWMMDYPGYGKSTGTLTEDSLYYEVLQVYKIARGMGYTPDSIIIYGRSLGSGLAAQLASVRDCKMLILESPYYSINNLCSHYAWIYPISLMIHYKIPTNEYLKKVTAPVIIFHGTDDGTIPYSNAEKLRDEVFKKGDTLIPIEGGDHNNLNDFPQMHKSLDSLLGR